MVTVNVESLKSLSQWLLSH